ncbi:nuclear transport factor 2 family protein [Croceicoccus mobilis]|uniref:SnoaL-like domain-containing protein n=1 Tax=Croceicoccus mobilis TaxID=1703339 RepID=A0A917DX56_9SPHN|nr:nuclear transport factor 2 family protein [Croceicoccus mobilis]GGD75115.1 hypothetical protein GCM10010990_25930 [Croceicoccus mobilis]
MATDTEQLLRAIYAQPRLVFEHLHPDFVCHSPGPNPMAGTFRGAKAFAEHLGTYQERSQGAFALGAPVAVMADGAWATVVTPINGSRDGKAISMFGLGVWRFEGDKLAEHWECVSDQQQWDAFWS